MRLVLGRARTWGSSPAEAPLNSPSTTSAAAKDLHLACVGLNHGLLGLTACGRRHNLTEFLPSSPDDPRHFRPEIYARVDCPHADTPPCRRTFRSL